MNKKILGLFLTTIFIASIFSGCTEDSINTNDNNQNTNNNDNTQKTYTLNTNYPRDTLGLNEKGEQAFSAAIEKYSELKENMSAEEAKTALIDTLNNGFENIKEARLSEDGYTIGLVFEDDTAALMVTYNHYYENLTDNDTTATFSYYENSKKTNNPSNTIITPISAKTETVTPVASNVEDNEECEAIDFIVPQNKKVYYFRADYTNCRYTSYEPYMFTRNIFLGYDWPVNDIVEIHKKSWRDMTTSPENLLNMSGFGIIIYTGIGGYYDFNPKAIPGNYYIQCCAPCNLTIGQLENENNYFLEAVGEERFKQYITWRDQGRLIFTGYERDDGYWIHEYSMDVELIKDEGKLDQGALVFFNTGNSWRCRDIFRSLGAGCFIGWDGRATAYDGINPLLHMFQNMIGPLTTEPQHISEAYDKLSFSFRESYLGGTLKIDDYGLDFYLPSFGTMIIDLDDPPTGTTHYWISIYPYGTTKIMTDYGFDKEYSFDAGDEIEYDGVSPIDTYITINAKDIFRVAIDSGIIFPELNSGKNPLKTYTEWEPYGIILEADPSTVEPDGTSTSTITATLKTFNDDDVTEPTGEPLPCKQVEFITNFGTFTSNTKVWTDLNGQATINITSETDGIATIRAIVEYDAIESYKTQNITFGEVPYSFRLVERRTTQTDSSGDIIEVMAWGYYLVFKGTPGIDAYIITRNCTEYTKEYSTDGKLPYEDDYYQDLRILTDEERTEWNIEYDEKGLRFYLFRGQPVSISETSDAWQTTLSEKQEYLYNSLTECIFSITAYNS